MRKIPALAIAALALVSVLAAGCASQPATTQEKLTRDGAEEILNAIAPGIEVLSLEPSQVEGLYEAVVVSGGQKGLIYVDSSGKYAVLGSIVEISTKENLTKKKFEELQKVDTSLIPLDDAIVLGDRAAPQKVVVFDDPD